jgi:hypothetical protein
MRRFGGRALGRRRLLLSQVDASPQLVIFRESGGSSTPQLLDSSISVSGILDRPPEPVIGRRESADPVADDDSGGCRALGFNLQISIANATSHSRGAMRRVCVVQW